MSKNLITKTEFASRCGVTGGAVTKFVKGRGKDAVVGQRIDFSHPAAQEYLQEKTAPGPEQPATGVDALFEQALEGCKTSGRWTPSSIQRHLSVGYTRACKIFSQLQTAGQVPAAHQERPPPAPTSTASLPSAPKVRPRQHGKGRKSSWEDDAALVEVPDDIEALADLTLRELIAKFGTEYRFVDWLKALKEIEAVNEKRIKNAQSTGKLVSRDLVKTAILDQIDGVFVKLLTDAVTTISARATAIVRADGEEIEVKKMVEDQLSSFIRPVKDRMRKALPHEED